MRNKYILIFLAIVFYSQFTHAGAVRHEDPNEILKKAEVIAIATIYDVIRNKQKCSVSYTVKFKPPTKFIKGKLPNKENDLKYFYWYPTSGDKISGPDPDCPRVHYTQAPMAKEHKVGMQLKISLVKNKAANTYEVTGTYDLVE
jgi:hypothetical protein